MATKTKAKSGKRKAGDPIEEALGNLPAGERSMVELLQPTNAIVSEWETLGRTGCDDALIEATVKGVTLYHERKNGCGGVCYFTATNHTVYWLKNGCDFWLYPRADSIAGSIKAADLPADPHLPAAKVVKLVRDLFGIPEPAGATTNDEAKALANESKPKKTKPVQTKTKRHSEASAAQSMEVVIGSIVVPEGLNPRKNFDEQSLARLAESIKVDGLIQPLAVRKVDDGSRRYFELLAGERRLRAAKLAGLKTVPVTIRSIDDAAAARIRLAENYFREDLNPIEEAAAFQSLIDEHGFTQRELADYWDLSQGKIGNAVRLLKLPEEWQQRVISQEITPTMGRDLAAWVDVPGVLDDLAQSFKKGRQELTSDAFKRELLGSIKCVSRPLSGYYFDSSSPLSGEVYLTPKDKKREDLQVRAVPTWNGKETRAFNIKLWEELQKAGQERRAQKNATAKSGIRKPDPSKLSPAEQKRRTQQKREQHEAKLRSYYLGWLQKLILAHLDEQVGKIDPHVWIRIVLYFACDNTNHMASRRWEELAAIIKKHGGKKVSNVQWHHDRVFESLASVPNPDDFRLVIVQACRAWVAHPFEPHYQADLQPEVLTTLAAEFGISLESHWACDRAFLELHSKEQLLALAKEWKTTIADGKRTAMIDELDIGLRMPPKSLLKAAK